MLSAFTAVAGMATVAPPAYGAQAVTYEIVSNSVPVVDVEYIDTNGRTTVRGVALPWRITVLLDDPKGPTGVGAQLRADWRWDRGPARWVTVRIFEGPKLLCQSTLDVGNIACYGNTPHVA